MALRDPAITWCHASGQSRNPAIASHEVEEWICVAPIWVLPEYFDWMITLGVRRVVALSSTSRFTKGDSSDLGEQAAARRLVDGESQLQQWAEAHHIDWIILRPTMIYGLGRDRNLAEVARFIRRFGLFPLLGRAEGLRQPIHVQDLADACLAALQTPGAANRAYNLSGGEILPYHEMINRVFTALGRPARMISVPLSVFRLAVAVLRFLPRYLNWTEALAERLKGWEA
jgi:nucleoside-diphosphate-sugar epimerase